MRLAWEIARRYLAPKRGGRFLSFITWISLGGVTVGVTALVVVIAVMTGAQEEFQEKILETSPHILLLEYSGSLRMGNWRPVLDSVKAIEEFANSGSQPGTLKGRLTVVSDVEDRRNNRRCLSQ